MHSDKKIRSARRGVSFTNARKKRCQNAVLVYILLRKNFQNSILVHSITICLSEMYWIFIICKWLYDVFDILVKLDFSFM
jgi:hypothetical protein